MHQSRNLSFETANCEETLRELINGHLFIIFESYCRFSWLWNVSETFSIWNIYMNYLINLRQEVLFFFNKKNCIVHSTSNAAILAILIYLICSINDTSLYSYKLDILFQIAFQQNSALNKKKTKKYHVSTSHSLS